MLFVFPCFAEEQKQPDASTSIQSRTSLDMIHLSGPGKASSFYISGVHVNEEVDILDVRPFRNTFASRFELNMRATDNDQIDPEEFSIEKMRWNLKDQANDFTLGDHFANFSQYTMNKSIKGLGYQHNFKDDMNYLRFAAGIFDGQWEYLYKDPQNEPMDRYGGGLRYQRTGENHMMGFNLAIVDDRAADENRTTQKAFLQEVGAFDWEYRTKYFKFNGEHAYSNTNSKTVTGVKSDKNGMANKVRMKGRYKGVGMSGHVENVAPDFNTLAGGATPDRRRYKAKVDKRFSKSWRGHASFSQYYNKLSGSTATTRTSTTTYEVGVTRSRPFGRKYMKASLTLRRKDRDTGNDTTDTTSDRLKFSLSDRLWKRYRYRFNFEGTFDEDDVGRTRADNLLYSFNLSSRHRLKNKWNLRPSLNLSHQETDNVSSMGYDITSNVRLGLSADHPGGIQAGFNFEYSETDVTTGTDSDTLRINVFGEKQFKQFKNSVLRLTFNLNDYNFTNDTPAQDYKEELLNLTYRIDL